MDNTPSFPVRFLLSNEVSRKTRWRWSKGDGELRLDGDQVTLSGRRWRPFLRGSPQSVSFPRMHIRDVKQQGDTVQFAVALEGGKPEPVVLQFPGEEAAGQVAAAWPTDRTAHSLDQETFALALARTGVRPWVTPTLIGICVLVFIVMAVSGVPALAPIGPELLPWGTDFGPLTLRGEPWRLFTSMFLHFGILHLALNMWALLSLGPLTERLLGNVRFVVLYLVAGLCGSMASMLWNPVANSAGASGAIFGVMGALLALMVNPRSRVPPAVAATHRNSALVFLAYNVLNSFRSGIDMAAHLGGLGAGFVLGWLFARPLPEAHRPPLRVSPLPGMAAAAALLVVLAWPLFHPGVDIATRRAFRFTLLDFGDAEQAAVTRMKELQQQYDNHRITDRQWAQHVESDIVPMWKKVADTAAKFPTGITRQQQDLSALLSTYASGQIEIFHLTAEGVLQNDQGKVDRAGDLKSKQDARLKGVRDLIKQL